MAPGIMSKCGKKQERLLTLLRQSGRLSVADAVKFLKTSEATVRRYFHEMEQRGLLMRVCGGACLNNSGNGMEYHFDSRALSRLDAKREIGKAAAALIRDHERLFFDSGTTVRECGNCLAERMMEKPHADVTIITNSLVYNETLARKCTMNLLGGTIRIARMDLCGMIALHMLNQYNFTKALLGVDGISEQGELSTTDEETSLLAKTVVEHSREVLILADSSKLGSISFVPYAVLHGEKFTLITDDAADRTFLEKLSGNGIRIVIAEENGWKKKPSGRKQKG